MFAPVDTIIGAYGSIFNNFQTSNQKSVLKNKWLSNFLKKIQKSKKIPTYLPYLFLCYANQTLFLGLSSMLRLSK